MPEIPREPMQMAFDMMDVDGDGHLSRMELDAYLVMARSGGSMDPRGGRGGRSGSRGRRGRSGSKGRRGRSGSRGKKDTPPPEWFWEHVTNTMGMDRELFWKLARQMDKNSDHKEVMMYFDMGDANGDGYLQRDEFFQLHMMLS